MAKAGPDQLAEGVWTVSSGNMAQAVAWAARALGVPCTVYVPDTTPRTKLANIVRYGATPVERPFREIVQTLEATWQTGRYDGAPGQLIHPFSDPDVMAGAGTIGLEILEDLPDVDAVIAPWGGGGLCCGMASALRARGSRARIYASEVDATAPLSAALAAGHPVAVPFVPSFVDGIGAPFLNPELLDLARRVIDGAIVTTREESAAAVRLVMERARVVAEGAAATAVAAALSGRAGAGRIACVVSGGNIDIPKLVTILQGGTPS
jgi:threonine dehydratase